MLLTLAESSDVVSGPRSRAERLAVKVTLEVARSWRADVPSSHRRVYQLASSWLSVAGRVDARDSKVHCWSVVRPRAVGGRLYLWGTGAVKFASLECAHP